MEIGILGYIILTFAIVLAISDLLHYAVSVFVLVAGILFWFVWVKPAMDPLTITALAVGYMIGFYKVFVKEQWAMADLFIAMGFSMWTVTPVGALVTYAIFRKIENSYGKVTVRGEYPVAFFYLIAWLVVVAIGNVVTAHVQGPVVNLLFTNWRREVTVTF